MSVSKIITRNIKRVLRLWYACRYVSWTRFFVSLVSGKADAYVIYPSFFTSIVKNDMEHCLLLYAAVQKNFNKVKFVHGKRARKVKSSIVFYMPSESLNYSQELNYTKAIFDYAVTIEKNNNRVFYKPEEVLLWENKVYMYRQLEQKRIHHPATTIVPLEKVEELKSFKYPCLVKEEHSRASQGVHKVNSYDELLSVVSTNEFAGSNEYIIVQNLMAIHRDLRVIYIGDELFLHYWRVNPDKEWKPTSTSHGSEVDFVTFPEKWRNYMFDSFKRLEITTGAFDVAWENDDLDTEPFVLEVSPVYQPNPPVSMKNFNFGYGEYKKKLMFKNSWDYHYINIAYQMECKFVDSSLMGG